MEFVLVAGTENTAPISANGVPPGPTWAGKRLQQLSKDELDDMLAYCMKEGRRLGYEDTMECRPVRINPFHRRYLHGMPWLHFKSFYEVGRQAALNELRSRRRQAEPLSLAAA